VAPQALILMNNQHVRTCAQAFADRVTAAGAKDATAAELLQQAYAAALGRPPSAEELEAAGAFLKEQSAGEPNRWPAASKAFAGFCQVLLETNEFAYLP
jgi:hypothetical protein